MNENNDIKIGQKIARELFASRGNRTEVHINERDLAALLAFAAQVSRRGLAPTRERLAADGR